MTLPLARTTRRALLSALAALAVLASLPGPARAVAQEPGDRGDIARVEAYLNDIRTLRSRFVQTASNGSYAEGKLYVERPGRLHIDYVPPPELDIFADGTWLIMVDHELEEVNQLPLDRTPLAVLVDERVDLSKRVTVQRVDRRPGGLRVHLVLADEPDAGTLILAFADDPLRLRQWSVIDAQGVETRVALVDPEFNVEIESRMLQFYPPEWAFPGSDGE